MRRGIQKTSTRCVAGTIEQLRLFILVPLGGGLAGAAVYRLLLASKGE